MTDMHGSGTGSAVIEMLLIANPGASPVGVL
jgi:hypothetical protein